jgi:hypothetical protein
MQVPFFSDDEEPSTPKADALFIPRENPRALVIRPTEQWPMRASAEKASASKDISTPVHENGKKNPVTFCAMRLLVYLRCIRRKKERIACKKNLLFNRFFFFLNHFKFDSFKLFFPPFGHATLLFLPC